jgi:hypothetical protein
MTIPICLDIVLYEKVCVNKWSKEIVYTNPRFRTSIDLEISAENLKSIIAGSITVHIGSGFHTVSFSYRDWDKNRKTLSGKSLMREVACKGYMKDLHHSGWKKIRIKSKKTCA